LLQANAARKQFINGELVEVKAIQGSALVLADGRVIPENYRTFTHGYAVTSHAAQGKTVDEVIVVASSRSLPAVSREQFYVSISRGRDTCRVFTDDADLLRSHVTRSGTRLAAVEVISQQRLQPSVWQRSYQFLKRLRQRVAQFQSLSPRKGIIHPPRNEHEHRNTHRISH
jgi:ATP-dependent exoDNAse (exonuclease V) alpha subunit